jgi:hypothetical protein
MRTGKKSPRASGPKLVRLATYVTLDEWRSVIDRARLLGWSESRTVRALLFEPDLIRGSEVAKSEVEER